MTPVEVVVTDKNAIYVNGSRITDRGTKWGIHRRVDVFHCLPNVVAKTCADRGHIAAAKRIDAPEYKGGKARDGSKNDNKGKRR